MIRGVLFDLGGVVFESPLDVIAAFERARGLPPGAIGAVVVATGEEGAWARHERGELTHDRFVREFCSELAAAGHRVDVGELMRRVEATFRPRPVMLTAIDRLRGGGIAVGAVTNNWTPFGDHPVLRRFDVVVESVLEGVRKPDPEIYRRALARLGVPASETAMLDDLGPNLKTARALGMATIKVTDPVEALEALGDLVGIELVDAGYPRSS